MVGKVPLPVLGPQRDREKQPVSILKTRFVYRIRAVFPRHNHSHAIDFLETHTTRFFAEKEGTYSRIYATESSRHAGQGFFHFGFCLAWKVVIKHFGPISKVQIVLDDWLNDCFALPQCHAFSCPLFANEVRLSREGIRLIVIYEWSEVVDERVSRLPI